MSHIILVKNKNHINLDYYHIAELPTIWKAANSTEFMTLHQIQQQF